MEHVTRIHPSVAPDWPAPPDGGAGAHTVVIEGDPRIVVSVEATAEGGNRAAGGNATAAARLVNAIPWLRAAEPGLYDALDVPLNVSVYQRSSFVPPCRSPYPHDVTSRPQPCASISAPQFEKSRRDRSGPQS